jgi:hypothetical protein
MLRENEFLYIHPIEINFSTASGTFATSIFSIAPPGMTGGRTVREWGIVLGTAQAGGSAYTLTLQRAGTTVDVSASIDLTTAAAASETSALGNGTTIAAGGRLELELLVTGTVTTTAKGTLWVNFLK